MPSYCIPILCPKAETVLKVIDENASLYDYFEVWLGTIENLDDGFLSALLAVHAKSLIILFRKKNLEVPFTHERCQYFIRELANSSAYLDLDIVAQRKEIDFLLQEKLPVKTILSYHNYTATPPESELREYKKLMIESGAHVCKFSTYCNSPGDAVRLLQLEVELKQEGREHIVLGMGEHGAVTRVFGTMWGNKMVFAPREAAHASSPGQLTRDEIESAIEIVSRTIHRTNK